MGGIDVRPERCLDPVLGLGHREGLRLPEVATQPGHQHQGRQGGDVEDPPAQRRERDDQEHDRHQPEARHGDDAQQREAGAATVGTDLLADDDAGQRLLGGEEQPSGHLEHHEGDQPPRQRGGTGGDGEGQH